MLSIANKPIGNYVEIINNLIPDGVIKIRADCKRISEKIRVLCWKINEKTKKLKRSGSISQRNDFLEEFSKLSILVSDVMTAWEYEQDKKRVEKKLKAVELDESMENWKQKYENLEEEKRALFEEMMEQNSKEKKPLENIFLNHTGSIKLIRLKIIYSLNCINFIHSTELWTCQVKPLHPKPGSMIYLHISYHLLC